MSDEPVGSLGEEAAKLFGALSGWASEHAQEVDDHLATGTAECLWCPVCRAVHAVRTANPEVKAQLATAAQSLLEAATGLLAAATQSAQQSGHQSAQPSAPQSPSSVQHIDLDDDADDDPFEG